MNRFKKIRLYVGITILAVGCVVTGQFLAQRARTAYAARSRPAYSDESSCVSGSGAASVESVQEACRLCFNSGQTTARGALWFSSSSSERDTDIVKVSDPNATTANIYLWGQAFACGQSPSSSTAWHIWFGRKDKDTNPNSDAVPYLVPNDASTSKYRGEGDCISTGCYSYVWTTAVPPDSGWTLKVQEFKNDPDTVKTITAEGLERYEAIVSVNRCYNKSKNGISSYSKSRSDCYGENSHIVLEIPPADNSGFSSKSRVSGGSGTNESSDWGVDDAGTLEVEADASGNATVYFSHALRYKNTNPDGKGYGEASTTGTISFDDGSASQTVPFSAPGDSSNTESGWLTSDAGIEKNVTLGSGEGEKTICSTITYITKTVNWSNSDPHIAQSVNDSGSTKACAKIVRSETEEVGYIEFWSRSHVESVHDAQSPDVVYNKASTYDNFSNSDKYDGDKVTLRLSTDYTNARANFRHDLGFDITLNGGITIGANDTVQYGELCTNWTIHSNETSSDGETGEYCADTQPKGHKTDVQTTLNHEVNIGSVAGAEGSAEEKITFKMKKVPILRKEDKSAACGTTPETNSCSYNPKRWIYYAEDGAGSDEGSSAARIEYVRPIEPDGDGPSSHGAGAAEGAPMYAGEIAKMIWSAHAKPNETRRVMRYESVAFLVPVSKGLSSTNVKGTYQNANPRYPNREGRSDDPCAFWRSRLGPLRESVGGCASVTSQDVLTKTFGGAPGGTFNDAEASPTGQVTMAVPDWVGDKYCNGFGYKWGYYHGIMNTMGPNANNWEWKYDNQNYWVHYNAACRTIAKKPSIALWNGGLFAGQGNVSTSTSPRYNSPSVGLAANAASGLRRFGSWTEYLANVNGSVGSLLPGVIPGVPGSTGLFSSGAAFAWNGSVNSEAIKNSPLTIQNVNSSMLGFSGVDSNSALLDRLEAYFKTAATNSESTIGNISGLTDSRIYYVNGDVTINGSISIASSADSVYQIPQVVIFATGSINITENVDRIDAWLISKNGKVDTCTATDLADNSTQANVNGASGSGDSRPLRCEKKLVINGPVFAKTITADRSFGSDGTSNNDTDPVNTDNIRAVPAEVFIL